MWLALIGALAIGLTLGLLGSGGSILTVPVLVYLVGQPEKVAIAGSLAIVGGVALAGALPRMFKRQVDWRSVLWFGLPGMFGSFIGSAVSTYIPGVVQLFVFALVMLVAATMMARPTPVRTVPPPPRARDGPPRRARRPGQVRGGARRRTHRRPRWCRARGRGAGPAPTW